MKFVSLSQCAEYRLECQITYLRECPKSFTPHSHAGFSDKGKIKRKKKCIYKSKSHQHHCHFRFHLRINNSSFNPIFISICLLFAWMSAPFVSTIPTFDAISFSMFGQANPVAVSSFTHVDLLMHTEHRIHLHTCMRCIVRK